MTKEPQKSLSSELVDHSSSKEFFEYYAQQSVSPQTQARFKAIKELTYQALRQAGRGESEVYDVADIGCGAGVQSILWALDGHKVKGLDVNEPLINLARQRTSEQKLNIEFELGSADNLPWPDACFDICIVPELLEHVVTWEKCLDEFARILRPGGLLFLTTTNSLCPKQEEYELPLYSWYPGFVKRHYEKLAVTTRPELVSHATYPAVNWFTNYSLARELRRRGIAAKDRFDIKVYNEKSLLKRTILNAINHFGPFKFIAYVFTPYSLVCGFKQ